MHHHVVAKSTYYQVAVWLAVFLAVTVVAASVDLGHWNVPIALVIASIKAVLIVLFFMHVRYGSPLLKLFAAGGFFWLLIMFVFLASDVLTR